jgi:hypothetical protein
MSRAKVRVYNHGVQPMNVYPTSIPDLDILLDTPEWFEWLDSQTQFKYCGNLTEMSVKRRPNGKWYARKKILSSGGSKPIDLYIGSDEECTSDKLKEVNYHFSKDNSEFWRWYYDPARRGDKHKGVQSDSVYTLAQETSESGEDVAKFQSRISELEEKLREAESAIANLEHRLKQETQRADDAVHDGLEAADILRPALKLKPQAGGAIKEEIRKALLLIDDI